MKRIVIILIMILLFIPITVDAGNQITYVARGDGKHVAIQNGTRWTESCKGDPCAYCGGSNKPKHYHNKKQHCSATHCSHTWCSCGSGKNHNCGGGCNFSTWTVSEDKHVQYCTRGCGRTKNSHSPNWSEWSTNHTIKCNNCELSGSHTPTWGGYETLSSGEHGQKCTNKTVTINNVTVNTKKSCVAITNKHNANFSNYYKSENKGESDGSAAHVSNCQVSGCTISGSHPPIWGDWISIGDKEHRRNCKEKNCGLTQTLTHRYTYTPIEGNYNYHLVGCEDCDYSIGNGNSLAEHKDVSPVDGTCDQCKMRLAKIVYEPDKTELTNSDVKVTITLYKGDEEIVRTHIYTENNINDLEEERYEFDYSDEGINWQYRPQIDNINKTVSGRIQYTPSTKTSDSVKITFLPDYEEDTYGNYAKEEYNGRSKQIYGRILIDGEAISDWKLAETEDRKPTIDYTFTKNGVYEIELKDTVGNGDTTKGKESVRIPIVIDWIVSGQATTATTSDVLANGTVFTDILINTDKEWEITNAQEQIKVKIYRVTENAIIEETEKEGKVKVSKLEIKNFNEEKIVEEPIGRGLYYIKTGIGGPGVFTLEEGKEKTRYILEIEYVNASGTAILGGNRIEVTVNKLNNLT